MRLALAAHIVAGGIGILSGFVAIFVVKGATMHRGTSRVFVYSMLVMSLLGALIAAVRPASAGTRGIDLGQLALACGIGVFLASYGASRSHCSPRRSRSSSGGRRSFRSRCESVRFSSCPRSSCSAPCCTGYGA